MKKEERFAPDITIGHLDTDLFDVLAEISYHPFLGKKLRSIEPKYSEDYINQKYLLEAERLARTIKVDICTSNAYVCVINDLIFDFPVTMNKLVNGMKEYKDVKDGRGVQLLIYGLSLKEKEKIASECGLHPQF